MKHESRALDSLDKIIDLIWHEEGRLAIINRYGAYLSDDEKAQATQLITSQKANMDRLFTIYRDELLPLMHEVRRNSEAMDPLFDKLLTSAMIARQMNGEQNVTEQSTVIDAVRTEEAAMQDGTALVNNTGAGVAPAEVASSEVSGEGVENAVEVTATEGSDVVGAVSEPAGDSVVPTEETVSESQFNLGDVANAGTGEGASDASVDTSSVVEESQAVSNENPLGSGVEIAGETTSSEGASAEGAPVEGGSDNSEVTLSSMEEESAAPFVLSPIDEDVAPAVTEEEAKKAEETIAQADQQLGTIDAMKTDIMASTELTEEEKTEKLEQYTRISDVAVKAILVTKAQCEKLLASRASQKALLSPKAEEVTADVTSTDEVVALPDLSAGEGEAVVALPAADGEAATTEEKKEDGVVIPAIGSDAPASDAPVTSDNAEATATDGVVLPMIGADAPASDAPAAEAVASDAVVSDLVLEIPGAAPSEAATDAQNSQNELQTMIEQANALYKEGKTAEAQALFEKIGTMNKEAASGDASSEVAEDAAVLVKK